MNQQKIGRFLRELRSERGLTQEQVAEELNVSNRSVSRWENGITMPDFDLLLQIADNCGVEVGELLDGERKSKDTHTEPKDTLMKAADYQNTEKIAHTQKLFYVFLTGILAMVLYLTIDALDLITTPPYDAIAGFLLGLVLGGLLAGALYSSRYMYRIKAAKLRLLRRLRERH